MDLISDMLFGQLSAGFTDSCTVQQIRPAMMRFVSRLKPTANSRDAWMADRLLNRHVTYPRLLRSRARDFDLFHVVDHSYASLVGHFPASRSVVTCHDLDAFQSVLAPRPGMRAKCLRILMGRALDGLCRAAHVIFVSHAVRKNALRLGLVTADRSSVIPMGVHPACGVHPHPSADRQADELLGGAPSGPVLLHVGSVVKRKRVDIALSVTAEVAKRFPNTVLVRVGGPLNSEQRCLAKQLNIVGRVVELPFLERDVLAAVYRRADLVLQPSEAEGFGLPVVEAMACGCPVIASDIEVLREVGGSAAEYCPVGDVEFWTRTAVGLLEATRIDPGGREKRARVLAKHAGQFSWLETTRKVVAVYKHVLGKGN